MEDNLVTAELHYEKLLEHATLKKVYKGLSKYPAITEDISFTFSEETKTGDVMRVIKEQSKIITDTSLLDVYRETRTFHIVYQDPEKNLTSDEVGEIRKKIIAAVEKHLKGKVR